MELADDPRFPFGISVRDRIPQRDRLDLDARAGQRYRELVVVAYAAGPPPRDVLAEHREIMEAALERDADRAVKLATEHIETTAANLLKVNHLQ